MNIQKAIFAGGCFWCTEAIFQTLKGVRSVTSGYIGGKVPNPGYLDVCNGDSGHAEAVEIMFDADEISFNDLLLVFFKTHNPTSVDRQGNDNGNQYRSAVFYCNEEQKQQTEAMIRRLTSEQIFDKPIVTTLEPATAFYKAEERHQNYFSGNPDKPYCAFVIQPKMNKFAKEFHEKMRPEVLL